jgi:putative DNA primase/helicase
VSAYRDAALAYAAAGYPVFPCNPMNKQPLLAADKDASGKAIRGTGGVSKATTAPEQIRTWWKRWPNAMIGLATGHNRMFVLDFDPRTDPVTGEVFALSDLKAALESQMACALPESRTAITQSGGVHVWLHWPDDGGDPVRNRGNLPPHVDVRGLGGYVIAPPSRMDNGNVYRWMKDRGEDRAIADAPPALIEILRSRGQPKPKADAGARSAETRTPDNRPAAADAREAAIRKYADAALLEECRAVRSAGSGARNAQLNRSAFAVATLVAAGAIEAGFARSMIEAAAADNPGRDSDAQIMATIDSGWDAGLREKRDLSAIGDRAGRTPRRPSGSATGPHPPAASGLDGRPAPGEGLGSLAPPAAFPINGAPSSRAGGPRRNMVPEGGWGPQTTRWCAFRPLTDLGNLERFVKRYGADFRYVEAWGWVAWDGQRWNRELASALLGQAIQITVRAIQEEADLIAASGIILDRQLPPAQMQAVIAAANGAPVWFRDDGDIIDLDGVSAEPAIEKAAFDRLIKITREGVVTLYSGQIAAWGRTSEGAGHIGALNKSEMLQSELVALADDFDRDPMRLNVLNGTLAFARSEGRATVHLLPFDRADFITKIANAAYDPPDPARGHAGAICPVYDAYLERVQPEAEMRHFLDAWAGYNMLGDTTAQVFALFYGQGANGKSVWVDAKAHILGDYARVCGIETFIDQGKYRKGSDATPDLAALAGRRMVRASEPEAGSKFSDGLIKALTGTEPMPVRELLRPPFEMNVTFKVTVSANDKPKIGTDHGIQRRVRLVPWDVIIPDAEQDKMLLTKIKAEADGILLRMIEGAILYLGNGLPMPQAIEDATREYREENDILGRFLVDCVIEEKGGRVQAKVLQELFVAWQTAMDLIGANGKPWSPKYLNSQMLKKGYKDKKSSNIYWLDIKLLKTPHDYSPEAMRAADPPDDDWVPF